MFQLVSSEICSVMSEFLYGRVGSVSNSLKAVIFQIRVPTADRIAF